MFHRDPNTHVATKEVFVEVNVLACSRRFGFLYRYLNYVRIKETGFCLRARVNKNDAEINTDTIFFGITNIGSLMYDGHAHDTTFEKEKQHK